MKKCVEWVFGYAESEYDVTFSPAPGMETLGLPILRNCSPVRARRLKTATLDLTHFLMQVSLLVGKRNAVVANYASGREMAVFHRGMSRCYLKIHVYSGESFHGKLLLEVSACELGTVFWKTSSACLCHRGLPRQRRVDLHDSCCNAWY